MTAEPAVRALELDIYPVSPASAGLCARLIARYASSPDDGDLLADQLGLDEGVRTWNSDYARIMRLADSIGARS